MVWEELLRRLPDIHVAGPVRRMRSNFINIAEGSAAETEYRLLLSGDLGNAGTEPGEALTTEATEIARMLYALRLKVES